MIIRIFTAQIHENLKDEFEEKLSSISIPFVEAHKGVIDIKVGRPLDSSTHEFLMISRWENLEDLKRGFGQTWQDPKIPEGMEQYIHTCEVKHFEEI